MAGFTYATLTTAIQNYTEVGTSVLSSTITDQFIDIANLRIFSALHIDTTCNDILSIINDTNYNIQVYTGDLFVKGLHVYRST